MLLICLENKAVERCPSDTAERKAIHKHLRKTVLQLIFSVMGRIECHYNNIRAGTSVPQQYKQSDDSNLK